MEREKARQRTGDAMARKARAGHVTGGRVFGYDNVDVMGELDTLRSATAAPCRAADQRRRSRCRAPHPRPERLGAGDDAHRQAPQRRRHRGPTPAAGPSHRLGWPRRSARFSTVHFIAARSSGTRRRSETPGARRRCRNGRTASGSRSPPRTCGPCQTRCGHARIHGWPRPRPGPTTCGAPAGGCGDGPHERRTRTSAPLLPVSSPSGTAGRRRLHLGPRLARMVGERTDNGHALGVRCPLR